MKHRDSRGFTLIEVLIVIGLIGVLSLVSVPAFMNYQRSAQIRGATRTVAQDLRNCRQRSITRNTMVRFELIDTRQYEIFESSDNGATWTPLSVAGGTGATGNIRSLDSTIAIAASFSDDTSADPDTRPDLDFRPDGTVDESDTTITLTTTWSQAAVNKVVITISATGQIKSVASKV